MEKIYVFILIVLCFIYPQPGWAQLNPPPSGQLASFPINPLPSGARCMSMGNACTAIADDIDMLMENPAAVAGLDKPRVNIQLRSGILETTYLDQEALNSQHLGSRPGQIYKPLKDKPTDISFFAISKPFETWTLSAYFQKTLGFDGDVDIETILDQTNDFQFTNLNSFSASYEQLGLSAAFKFLDVWAVGISVMTAELDINSWDTWELSSISGQPILASNYSAAGFGNNLMDSSSDILLQFGLLYKPAGKFSAGLNFRQGGDFDFNSEAQQYFIQNEVTDDLTTSANSKIALADSLSVGIGWQFNNSMQMSLDIEHLTHSDLPATRINTLGLNLPVSHLTEAIDDTFSYKIGFEKKFTGRDSSTNQYAIRLGITTEDDHDGVRIIEGYDTQFSAGFGAIFGSRQQYKMDLGIRGGDEEILLLVSLNYLLH